MYIPLVYEHLFYKYVVLLSVGKATKGKRASVLMDVVILVFIISKNCASTQDIYINSDIHYLLKKQIIFREVNMKNIEKKNS